ncbi:importin [Niveomyces insectorum RCEF 264]|uniref:Importin n=1 Tax=Niveomyces insectorum RCEF 264 TaxID=1081102 RepID=A0A167R9V7_9HYPO|nr:importin [Niveomyces insectorum RCEF 264]
MDQPSPLPTSLAEVLSLILALYDPQTAHTTIATIQETLQRLQKAPEGWRLAQTFLDRPVQTTADDQIKFFGALTIIVKLNTESSALSNDDARELLQNLLRWLAESAGDNAGVLSTQKLCHALVTFFIHFPALWPRCVHHLVLCLRTGRNVPLPDDANADTAPGTAEMATSLDWHRLRVALWFINTLVTDVAKTDARVAKFAAVHDQLVQNAADVAVLLHAGLAPRIQEQNRAVSIQRESIKGLQSWILYAQRLSPGSDSLVAPLRALVHPVIACLQNEELYDAAIELLIDILSNYSNFFTAGHYDAMASLFESDWGAQLLQQLLGGDFDFEPLQYGLLMLAYGDARIQTIMQDPGSRSQNMLAALCSLLTAAGHPVAEDLIFVPALEFWATYIETLLDTMYTDADGSQPPWVQSALSRVIQVVGHCWAKIQYPHIKTFLAWDASDRAGFGDARKDVADLLQTVFAVAGRDLLSLFTRLLLQSIADKAWSQIEAAAFCLASLSDCIVEDATYDALLSDVFSAPLFGLLSLGEAQLPVRLRQTALSLIERYSEYFERHPAHLPAVLTLLFEAVAAAPLTAQASKAIATLCSSCRSLLTTEASAFLHQYQFLHDHPQLDSLAEERIVTAIASIIQAVSDGPTRLHLSEQLLAFIVRDIEQCLQLKSSGNILDLDGKMDMPPIVAKAIKQCQQQQQQQQQQQPRGGHLSLSTNEVLLQAVLISLRCLAGMARGLQSISEPVDLDASETDASAASTAAGSTVAENAQLHALQNSIVSMLVTVQSTFPRSSEVVEVLCGILKAGFAESEPGPFVFPPDMVTEVLTRQGVHTPYIGSLVNTAQAFASSLGKSANTAATAKSLGALVLWVLGLLQMLPEPEADTELTQRGIEFVDRVMGKNASALLRLEPSSQLEFFFLFTFKVLNGHEPLPKAASADFWTTFLTLKPEDDTLKAIVDNAMAHLGPLLADALVQNVGGNASRSELDKLSEPLKRLVVQHVRAQAWLDQALTGPAFPSKQVDAAAKATFLKKIVR